MKRFVVNSIIGAGIGYSIPLFLLFLIIHSPVTLSPESLRSLAVFTISPTTEIGCAAGGGLVGFVYSVAHDLRSAS